MSSEMPLSVNSLSNEQNLNISDKEQKSQTPNDDPANSCVRRDILINCLRAIVVCVCLFWFAYNAVIITSKYLQFDTIVSLKMEPPDEADLPGLTICGPFIIPPSKLVAIFKDKYRYNKTYSESLQQKKDNHSYYESLAFDTNFGVDIMNAYSLDADSLLADCVFKPVNLRHEYEFNVSTQAIECSQIAPIVESIYEGRKCFTYFSRMTSFNKTHLNTKMVYDMNPTLEVTIRIKDNLWSYGSLEEEVIMSVHPQTIIPTHLDFEYFRIIKHFYYDVYFTKKSSSLKKKPYKTGCKDYAEENKWKTREDCVNHCIKRESFSVYGCVNYYGVLTADLFDKTDKICSKEWQNYTVYVNARRKCVHQCPPGCTQIIYEIYGNVMDINDPNACVDDDDAGCTATVSIKVHHSPFLFINHIESLSTEEFIGTVGGHMGIWLGLSAIALFDLIIALIQRIKSRFAHKTESKVNRE